MTYVNLSDDKRKFKYESLIAGEFSDADPDGRHFNYLAFHVMRLISKSF
jgi:hypothetical protein